MKFRNKKGIVTLFFNVMIAILFIAAGFILFLFINHEIKDMGKVWIKESQNKDIADSYTGAFSVMNKTSFEKFSAQIIDMKDNDPEFFAHKDFLQSHKTFDGEVMGVDSRNTLEVDKYSSIYYNSKISGRFSVLNIISKLDSNTKIPTVQECTAIIYSHGVGSAFRGSSYNVDIYNFKVSYCMYKWVIR